LWWLFRRQRTATSADKSELRGIGLWALFSFVAFSSLALPLFVGLVGTQNERYVYLPSAFALIAMTVLIAGAFVGKAKLLAVPIGFLVAFWIAGCYSNAGNWNRASGLAATVYSGLEDLDAAVGDQGIHTIVFVNAPEGLRGYPVAGNCLDSAYKVLRPSTRVVHIYSIAKEDFGSPTAMIDVTRNGATIGGPGVSTALAGPEMPEELYRRLNPSLRSNKQVGWADRLRPDEMLVVLDGGRLKAVGHP
jgi:hypothetical protein